MLGALNTTVKDHLVKSRTSVRNWVEDEFLDVKKIVREEVLKKAMTKIHISYDL